MPGKRKYTIAICKGAALLNETRLLLEHWLPGESAESFANRAQKGGILGNATAYRSRDIIRRVFLPRFFRPTDRPARVLKSVLSRHLPYSVFRELVLFFAARHDPLIYDFIVCEFWPSLRRGRLSLNVSSVLSFFSQALADGMIEKPWSEEVSKKVARGLLGFLRDVGYLRDASRGIRELLDYRLSNEGLVIIARFLHDSGFHNAFLCGHEDWRLFGLDEATLMERMDLLDQSYGLLLQRAGSIIDIQWQVASIDELVALLACVRSISITGRATP